MLIEAEQIIIAQIGDPITYGMRLTAYDNTSKSFKRVDKAGNFTNI
jgi:hypothetical protein